MRLEINENCKHIFKLMIIEADFNLFLFARLEKNASAIQEAHASRDNGSPIKGPLIPPRYYTVVINRSPYEKKFH